VQALESFMLRCPRDISPYCEGILNLALEYVSYDPNFTDSMEEDTDEEGLEEDDDEYVTSMPSCLQNNPIDQLA
jgi:cullin-associated NEDD8-dissociated protein 1